MDGLMKLLMEKAGLTEDQSQKAIRLMLQYLKERLPEASAAQVELLTTGSLEDTEFTKDIGLFPIP